MYRMTDRYATEFAFSRFGLREAPSRSTMYLNRPHTQAKTLSRAGATSLTQEEITESMQSARTKA